jgi:hypothetical protein
MEACGWVQPEADMARRCLACGVGQGRLVCGLMSVPVGLSLSVEGEQAGPNVVLFDRNHCMIKVASTLGSRIDGQDEDVSENLSITLGRTKSKSASSFTYVVYLSFFLPATANCWRTRIWETLYACVQ